MSETPTTVRQLRERMNEGLAHFLEALDQLSEEQQTGPRDAAGWNVRDHVTHLAVWADGVSALLRRQDRWAAMHVPPTAPESDDVDYDAINERIAERHHHLSASEARSLLVDAHHRLAEAVEELSDEQLEWKYDRFVAPFTGDEGRAIVDTIRDNSYGHLAEHLDWLPVWREGR
jgi:hypothetical protein